MPKQDFPLPERAALIEHLARPLDCIRWGASAFSQAGLSFGHGTATALDEAWYLVLHALQLPPEVPERYLQGTLLPDERARVIDLLLARLTTRKPAAYLTGEAYFCGLRFIVDERVIVPRSPLAELIASDFSPWLVASPRRILDLCAGSGCIAIASAFQFPEAEMDAVELDDGAMQVLRMNIDAHGLGGRVRALQGDLFAPAEGPYDLIVSNPPYVPEAEWVELADEYHCEPKIALTAGEDGMDIVARLLDEAPKYLARDGALVCEIGASLGEFEARFPGFPGMWPDFEHGGDGVFVVTRQELVDWLPQKEGKA